MHDTFLDWNAPSLRGSLDVFCLSRTWKKPPFGLALPERRFLMNTPRRHFSAAEKVAILKRHLLEKTPVSDLCDQLGIAPNLFYRWQKEFFENGHIAFENDRKSKAVEDAKERKIEQLEAKLQRKNEVLSELMEEHTQLKKELGEP